jgi:hypothetical protein
VAARAVIAIAIEFKLSEPLRALGDSGLIGIADGLLSELKYQGNHFNK